MNRSRRHDLLALAAPALLASLGLAAGCEAKKGDTADRHNQSMADTQAARKTAVATIRTSPAATSQPADGKPTGTVTFTESGDGKVKVVADLKGLPPNTTHGFHIHEKGDLSSPDFNSAGGHFNPDGHPHSAPNQPPHHAGDFGNITSDANGSVHLELTVDDISLGGPKNDVIGKAVIIHAKEDDFKTQPTGNAGGRIGGGVIEMQK